MLAIRVRIIRYLKRKTYVDSGIILPFILKFRDFVRLFIVNNERLFTNTHNKYHKIKEVAIITPAITALP